ncbi:hypothetical protein LJC42_04615 [Eubacteriales bacterium OttesenSCG-928-K08]|nr:hypothetical protein [Eubacteriales bacterium OttesenSCG-928-K08]
MAKNEQITPPDAKIKGKASIVLMQAFAFSAALVVVFVLAYMLSADLVARSVPEQTGGLLQVWGPPILISLAASVLCCLMMFLFKTKKIVPIAFAMLFVYYLVLQIVVHTTYDGGGADATAIFSHVINLYVLPPVIVGNIISWVSYLLYFKKREAPDDFMTKFQP